MSPTPVPPAPAIPSTFIYIPSVRWLDMSPHLLPNLTGTISGTVVALIGAGLTLSSYETNTEPTCPPPPSPSPRSPATPPPSPAPLLSNSRRFFRASSGDRRTKPVPPPRPARSSAPASENTPAAPSLPPHPPRTPPPPIPVRPTGLRPTHPPAPCTAPARSPAN